MARSGVSPGAAKANSAERGVGVYVSSWKRLVMLDVYQLGKTKEQERTLEGMGSATEMPAVRAKNLEGGWLSWLKEVHLAAQIPELV